MIFVLIFGICFSQPDCVVITNTQQLSDSSITKCDDGLFFKTCITYKNNIEHGLWERHFNSGEIKERRYYKYGEPAGQWTIWDKRGFVMIETNFDSDTIIEKTYLYNFKKNTKEITIKSGFMKGDRFNFVKKEVITEEIKD
jgi:antitoxin component YwqK of YwqJK toxin-antitoxin module